MTKMTKYKVRTIYTDYYWTTDIEDEKMLYSYFGEKVVERNKDDRIIDIIVMKTRTYSW